MKNIVTVACVALSALCLAEAATGAGSAEEQQGITREAQRDLNAPKLTGAGARDAIQIEAGSANSQVSIKASTKLASGTGALETLSFTASAPLAKGVTDATLATHRGLSSGTTVGLTYAHAQLKGQRVPEGKVFDDHCGPGSKFRTAHLEIKGNKAEDFACELGTIKDLVEKQKISMAEYRAFRSALYAPGAAIHSWGLTVSGGYRDATYFDSTTLAKTQSRYNGGSVGAFYSYMPLEATQLFSAAFSLGSAYKDAKVITACLPTPPAGGSLLSCVNGAVGAPTRQTTQTLDLEWRRKVSDRVAISVQLGRDFKDKVTSLQVPIYLVGNDKDGLAGGLSLGWSSDDKKVSAGVFVGKAFNLQP